MFTVAVCCFYTGVDVNLSLLPGAVYVKPGSFWALAGTPAIQSCLFSAKSVQTNLLSTWSAPEEIPIVQRRRSGNIVISDRNASWTILINYFPFNPGNMIKKVIHSTKNQLLLCKGRNDWLRKYKIGYPQDYGHSQDCNRGDKKARGERCS